MPVERITMDETATRGAALLAASAVGLLDDLAGVAADVPTADRVEPDASRHERYAGLVDRYDGITGMLLAHQETLHSDRKGPRPMNPTRVCLVGAGRAGFVHASNIRHHTADAEVVAIVDGDLERATRDGRGCRRQAPFAHAGGGDRGRAPSTPW